MAVRPVESPFTERELTFGSHVAVAMWVLSGALLAALAAWCAGLHWTA